MSNARVRAVILAGGCHPPLLNIGCGADVTIREAAELIRSSVRYTSSLSFGTSTRAGTLRKVLAVLRMASPGWRAQTGLEPGLRQACAALLKQAS